MSRWKRTKKEQRKKRVLLAVALICVVLFVATSIVYIIASHQDTPADAVGEGLDGKQIQALQMEYSQGHEFGKTKTLTQSKENFASTIRYPYLGMERVDQLIQKKVDEIVETYVSPYLGDKPNTPVQLDVQYHSYFINTTVGSITLEGTLYRPEEDRPLYFRVPLLINLKEGKKIENSEAFSEGYLAVLAKKCQEKLDESSKYQGIKDPKKLQDGMSAKEENYNNLAFTDEGISVFFQAGQVMPEEVGAIVLTIPYRDIDTVTTISYQPVAVDPGEFQPEPIQSPETAPQETESAENQETVSPKPVETTVSQNSPEPEEDEETQEKKGKEDLLTQSSRKIDPDKPMVALTFDDGPRTDVTPKVLSVLEKYNSAATFFMVGNRIEGKEDILKQMVAQGCEMANHTWEHKVLTELSVEGMKEQIEKTNDAAENATGVRPKLVRPPKGKFNDFVKENAGYLLIGWTVDTEDWRHKDPQKTLAVVQKNVFDGAIILMHDIQPSTAQSVEPVVKWLTEKGYQVVTVSELLQYSDKEIELGHYYRKQ